MILGLDTSTPTCKMCLQKDGGESVSQTWLAERRLATELLTRLEAFLQKNACTFVDLSGLVVFCGPGSFTGLRIGITVMNTLSEGLQIPIVGDTGENWFITTQQKLRAGENQKIVIPEYGSLPHVTLPKK